MSMPAAMSAPALCRDCFSRIAQAVRRCPACGSPRLLRHPELDALAIAHIDCDAFYAAIEKRDDPGLRDRPVIVGGGRRGVVATACYLARTYGVRSAMPMFKARKACPQAVVIRPDMAKYARAGKAVRALMQEVTPLVEPISIDEAFLDLSGTQRLHRMSPAETLARLAARIEAEIGISVSIGLSHNKFLAKLASDMDKPRGFTVIGRTETRDVLAPLPVGRIWGVGAAMQRRLAADGITRIADLQARDERDLAARYGQTGLRLARLARGEDARPVRPVRAAKSISNEITFHADIAEAEALERILWQLSEKVAARCKKARLAGQTVTLKLKTTGFQTRTRARTLPDPTQLADRIFAAARPLLAAECDGTPFRLLGVGVSGLVRESEADPLDLLDEAGARRAAAERAMDRVRTRFGEDVISKGRGLKP